MLQIQSQSLCNARIPCAPARSAATRKTRRRAPRRPRSTSPACARPGPRPPRNLNPPSAQGRRSTSPVLDVGARAQRREAAAAARPAAARPDAAAAARPAAAAPRRHLTSMRAPAGAAARPAAAPARPPPRRRASTAPRAALPDLSQLLRLPGAGPAERPLFRAADAVQMGPFKVAPMGIGTWAWGNKLLWGYDESRDAELQAAFNFAVRSGANLFDTADSYGESSCALSRPVEAEDVLETNQPTNRPLPKINYRHWQA